MKPRVLVAAFDLASARLALGAARASSRVEVIAVVPTSAVDELGTELRVATRGGLFPTLGEAREAGVPLALQAEEVDAACEEVLASGQADGLLRLEPAPSVPLVHVRAGTRVLLGQPLKPSEAVRGAGLVEALLGRRPNLVLLGTGQGPSLRALNSYEVEAPGSYRAAARKRPDLWVSSSPSEAELVLGLLGAGPEVALGLEGLRAWPIPEGQPRASDLEQALDALRTLAASRGDLAATRDPKAPRVSVSARAARPARDRCPYCHKHLSEYPDGRRGRPGPPIRCDSCGTGHHRDCLSEHGECTVLGCTSSVFTRLGAKVGVDPLEQEDARDWPFQSLAGDTGSGPAWLRVEAPLEDCEAPSGGPLRVHLLSTRVVRGEPIEGDFVFTSSRVQRLRGATLEVQASLSTRRTGDRATPWKSQGIVARRACYLGEPPSGAFGRLGSSVVNLLGGSGGVEVPAGQHRYPFSFSLPADHPKTLDSRRGDVEERVRTRLIAVMGSHRVEVELEVQ
jgi:hypothetical protein